MNDLTFNTTKLEEITELMNNYYNEYKELISSLDTEIKNIEVSWGSNDHSIYESFKEKYEEKKPKLVSMENMMKELLDTLNIKKEQLQSATEQSENNFE